MAPKSESRARRAMSATEASGRRTRPRPRPAGQRGCGRRRLGVPTYPATTSPGRLIAGLGATPVAYGDYPDGVGTVLNLVLPSDGLREAAKRIRRGGRLFTITFPPPRPEYIDRDDVRFELVLDVDGTLGGMAEVAA